MVTGFCQLIIKLHLLFSRLKYWHLIPTVKSKIWSGNILLIWEKLSVGLCSKSFLERQPCHSSVMVLCSFRAIFTLRILPFPAMYHCLLFQSFNNLWKINQAKLLGSLIYQISTLHTICCTLYMSVCFSICISSLLTMYDFLSHKQGSEYVCALANQTKKLWFPF